MWVLYGVVWPEHIHIKGLDRAAGVSSGNGILGDELLSRGVLVHPQSVLDFLRAHTGTGGCTQSSMNAMSVSENWSHVLGVCRIILRYLFTQWSTQSPFDPPSPLSWLLNTSTGLNPNQSNFAIYTWRKTSKITATLGSNHTLGGHVWHGARPMTAGMQYYWWR